MDQLLFIAFVGSIAIFFHPLGWVSILLIFISMYFLRGRFVSNILYPWLIFICLLIATVSFFMTASTWNTEWLSNYAGIFGISAGFFSLLYTMLIGTIAILLRSRKKSKQNVKGKK